MCTVDWGLVINAITATGAFFAGFVALVIATRDRHERKQEREDEEKTHARLVHLTPRMRSGQPVLDVEVRNFGPIPVLDVTATEATWSEHHGAPVAR
jgi:hypothetical protein